MHRVRQSVGYFREMGWQPTVVMVDPADSEFKSDPLLEQTLPEQLEIIRVGAFSTRWTRKLGLGSLALRSLWFYFREVNALLRRRKFDLVYFSTTMFPVLILGAYWKKRFKIPYVIDMQDPWHSEYYQDKPAHERPPKYWFAYRLNQYLEPIAMRQVGGIIAVSEAYHQTLQTRYPNIRPENCTVIPFGAFQKDLDVLQNQIIPNRFFRASPEFIHLAYVGRAGHDMRFALTQVFRAFRKGLEQDPALFGKVRMYFIGTDYAPEHQSRKTVVPVAENEGVADYVTEHPFRVPYFAGLQILRDADGLLMPGSDDPRYTASKLYPYILAKRPLLAVFHEKSSVVRILRETNAGVVVPFSKGKDVSEAVYLAWQRILRELPFSPPTNWQAFEPYMAREMTRKQVYFFEYVLSKQPE
ncbi:MAG: glycosyltransferase [Ferruginibacter sp.]|nr:glycosyltransferase [Cytophagales bacterium]